jgi:hypothetical protein
MTLAVGDRLGVYEVLGTIGSGGGWAKSIARATRS